MLYTMQNNVIYMALAHLDAVTFQIVYQLKIVAALVSHRPSASHRTFALTFASTAGARPSLTPQICHRFLLGKRVSAMRWLSVLCTPRRALALTLNRPHPNPNPELLRPPHPRLPLRPLHQVLLLTIGVVFVQLSTIEPDSAATSSSAAAASSSSSSAPADASSSSAASCSTDPLPSSSANADSASTGASAADPPLDESKKRTLGFAAVTLTLTLTLSP